MGLAGIFIYNMSEGRVCPYCKNELADDKGGTATKAVNWALTVAGDFALTSLNIKGSFSGGQVLPVPMKCHNCGRRYSEAWGSLSMKKEYSLRYLLDNLRRNYEPKYISEDKETTDKLYRERNEKMLQDLQKILNINLSEAVTEEFLQTHGYDACNYLLKEIGEDKPLKELFRYNTKETLFPIINKIIKSKGDKENLPCHINYKHKMKDLGVTGFFTSGTFLTELRKCYGDLPDIPYPDDNIMLGNYISKVLSSL